MAPGTLSHAPSMCEPPDPPIDLDQDADLNRAVCDAWTTAEWLREEIMKDDSNARSDILSKCLIDQLRAIQHLIEPRG